MMLRRSLRLLLLVGAVVENTAFVPTSQKFFGPRSSSVSSTLNARFLGPNLPIPPPPPPTPSLLDTVTQDITNTLDNFQFQIPNVGSLDLQSATRTSLENFQLPLVDLQSLKDQVQALDADIIARLESFASELQQSRLIQEYPAIQPLLEKLSAILGPLLQQPTLTLALSAVISYLAVSAILTAGEAPPPNQPYPHNKYEPIAARAYFDRRLPQVVARGLQILVQSIQFGVSLLRDRIDDKVEENEYLRGRELAQLLTKLGPTFIKVGQSLSIRTDLLSPAYIRGLETLQDQVPPFSTAEANKILEAEWGRPVESVLDGPLPENVVASASLGIVFKARLKESGKEVAIKVQRPAITEQIALDMHLLREIAPIVKAAFNLNSDTVGTVDAWGKGFVDELDYLQEAANAQLFSEKIKETPLKDVVFAPSVVDEFSTKSVLVTEWVEGERLDKSSNEDITILCSIAMNTYLTMLLELGLLHCDPHPGNLFRTSEGRLCILDWGMVTRLDKDLQLTLIEHMAHLTSADYEEIPRDLLLLGFIPQNKADLIDDSGVVELLTSIYGKWTKGGGAAAINVNDVINQLQDLTAEKGNLFQIPPYFAYIAKSFSVLEGIGLSNDEKYSIINECLPYVSKRLLTDKEACGPALSTFIFGPNKSDSDRIVDYKRVEQLVEGFGQYTTSASGALLGKEGLSRTEMLEGAAEQILDLIFTEEETPLQEIFLEQAAKIMTAGGRSLLTQIRERSGVLPTGRTVLGTVLDPLGFWRTSPLVRMNELDERTVETTRKLFTLMQKQIQESGNPMFDLSTLTREEIVALTSLLVRQIWERRMGVLQTSNRFARQLLELTARKLEIGERDSRTLPSRPALEAENSTPYLESSRVNESDDTPQLESSTAIDIPQLESIEASGSAPVSRRLQEARKRLEELTSEEINVPATSALPVKTDVSQV